MTAARLKASILQLAVTGKLVPQDPAEGTGAELLEQIVRAKSAKIPKGGPLSRAAKPAARSGASGLSGLSGISGDSGFSGTSGLSGDAPFEIPANWVWCKLAQVCSILNGDRGKNYPSKSKLHSTGEIPFISAVNMSRNTVPMDSGLLYLSQAQYGLLRAGKLKTGDLVVCIRGSLGKHCIFPFECGAIASSLAILRCNIEDLTTYISYFLDSPLFSMAITSADNGTAQPNLAAKELGRFPLPLPPLAEQKRIVARIEELMPLVEEYGKLEERRLQLDADLPGALEKAILQDAIQGKLVPQDPAEGTGEELLRKIFAAKNAKGTKKETRAKSARVSTAPSLPCPVSDPPFEIPASWAWCRLGDVCDYGRCQSATNIPESSWVLDLEDIEKDSGRLLRRVSAKERNSKSGKHAFRKGMVLYSKLRTYLNKVLVADEDGFCTSEIIPLDFGEVADPQYARLVLMSPYFLEYTAQCGYGVKMPRLGTEDGRKALFPLPPLAEQKRIVAKVEQLLAAVRKLKTEGDR